MGARQAGSGDQAQRRCFNSFARREAQREQIVDAWRDGTVPDLPRVRSARTCGEFLDELDASIETIKFDGKYYRQRMEQLAAMPAGGRGARRARAKS